VLKISIIVTIWSSGTQGLPVLQAPSVHCLPPLCYLTRLPLMHDRDPFYRDVADVT
jgi:hypothetical protein